jgi:hypothetical protein
MVLYGINASFSISRPRTKKKKTQHLDGYRLITPGNPQNGLCLCPKTSVRSSIWVPHRLGGDKFFSGESTFWTAPDFLSGRGMVLFHDWRRGWDSNPRSSEGESGFQDRHHKPLGHPSQVQIVLQNDAFGQSCRPFGYVSARLCDLLTV